MQLLRTIIVATLAVCLAVFPAGMTRALASSGMGGDPVVAGTHHHEHGGTVDRHGPVSPDAAPQAASFQTLDDNAGDCGHHGGDAAACASCCGFACHAFQPVVAVSLGKPIARALEQAALQDEQVGLGLLSVIERPPKSV